MRNLSECGSFFAAFFIFGLANSIEPLGLVDLDALFLLLGGKIALR